MPIRFICTTCGRKLRVSEDAAGQSVNCPGCQASLQVPYATAEPDSATANVVDAETVGASDEPPMALPVEQGEQSGERRPCPMCGELIAAKAAKCRFCGEIFDRDLRQLDRRKRRRGRRGETNGMAITSLVFGILALCASCIPLFGVPLGIAAIVFSRIAMNQSGSKGLATTGMTLGVLALGSSCVWGFLGAMAALERQKQRVSLPPSDDCIASLSQPENVGQQGIVVTRESCQ